MGKGGISARYAIPQKTFIFITARYAIPLKTFITANFIYARYAIPFGDLYLYLCQVCYPLGRPLPLSQLGMYAIPLETPPLFLLGMLELPSFLLGQLSLWRTGGGEAVNLHPGLWKIPPRLLENPTQGWIHPGFWKIPPRLMENPTQGSGKLQNLHKPCDYTFLNKQVSEEKL